MFNEDLTVFFQAADFGTLAVWTPAAGGGPFTIIGILNSGYFQSSIGDPGAAASRVQFKVSDTDLAQGAGIKRNDALVINSVTYKVAEIEQERHRGTTVLTLRT